MERKPYPGAPIARHLKVETTSDSVSDEFGAGPARTLARWLESLSAFQLYLIAGALLIVITIIDVITGPELAFSIFYLIPIGMLAWYCGWRDARIAVLVSTLMWLLADVTAGPQYSASFIRYWNAGVRFGLFAIVGNVLSRLRGAVDQEQRLARTDVLTGVANSRSFREILSREVARQRRYHHPLSMAFLDCDNFKQVNDDFGHAQGDELLRNIARSIRSALREVDMVARLGGDEFAILLPETDAFAADTVHLHVRKALQHASEQYNVTFSIGIVTYLETPASTDELLQTADQVMYEAKRAGKNTSRHRVLGSTAAEGTNA